MRIAISAQDNHGLDSTIAQHFGRCPYYVFVDIEGEEITQVAAQPNPFFSAHQPGQVPAFIKSQNADMMITGGIGRRAIALFEQYQIQIFSGANGTAREALTQALGGNLPGAVPCAGGHESDHGEHHDNCQQES